MDLQETMRELESLGSEQTRKTFLRHGASEPLFGVKFGDLEKLRKRIRTNAGLAEALWDTGNADARMLATMVADAAAMSWEHLNAWAQAINWHSLVDVFVSNVALRSPHFRTAVETWTAQAGELQSRAGWQLLAALATKTTNLVDAELAPWLPRIEQGIHTAQNRVREAMNTALIAIGGRGGPLRETALEVAKRIGKVEVDHGDTACETPDAAEYIERIRARKEGGMAKAAAVAKNAVDSVKDMAAKAQGVASSGAMNAVANAKNVMAGARSVVSSAQGVVSAVAKKAAAGARNVVSGTARKAPSGVKTAAAKKAPARAKKNGAAKKASPASTARKAAPTKRASTTAKKATAKRGASTQTKRTPVPRAAPASKRATAKRAAPAPKRATVKRVAPASRRATAKKAATPSRSRTGVKKGSRSRS
ncbi:DNA alkylation repair protein [Pyxidicoccus sp. MSG2]|uniref:DNA alkylation repair protein n=1 Tax=Pyxidicoccus sp. MSG2 TaxID=2996790 RepID=UPI00226F1AD0|nr:DNA alkylation repair protein [Pyxidicoccus sp. MSG2]MCY1019805.1 DNA alkylation repair protein [Pyxidicoccus sp. MSG2]